jgi:MATE family multidrug resistance protein
MSWAGIPIGLWLTFRRNMGLHGLWYGLTVSLVYGSTVGVWLALRTDWNREVQKVQKRLEADKAMWDENRTYNGEGEGEGARV